MLAGRDAEALDAAAVTARRRWPTVRTAVVDLADVDAVAAAGDEIAGAVADGTLPPLTAYVANAGLQVSDRRQRSSRPGVRSVAG